MLERVIGRQKELTQLWGKQVERLVKLGFPQALRMSEAEYRASLPRLCPQPQEFRHRFDDFLLVDPRLSLRRQCPLLGVKIEADLDLLGNYHGVETPQSPYQIWLQIGERYAEEIPSSCREVFTLRGNERGLTAVEGLALLREFPKIFYGRIVIFTGSQIWKKSWPHTRSLVPYIGQKKDRRVLKERWADTKPRRPSFLPSCAC